MTFHVNLLTLFPEMFPGYLGQSLAGRALERGDWSYSTVQIREFGEGKVDAVYPSSSIVAENPVAVVERTVAKKGTGELAKAYLDYLYSDEGQEIAAKHALRPRSQTVLKKYAAQFKPLQLFTVKDYFGSLGEAQKVQFNDGGQFDKLYTVK